MADDKKKKEKPPVVLGRSVLLSEGRIVFLGTSKQRPDTYFICFRNSDGDDLKFTISKEGMKAWVDLYTNPMLGMPLADFPHKMEWRVVKEGEEQ